MHVTKSQHYVPRKYLRSWENDGYIAMRYGEKIVDKVAIENVAQENYFYRYEYLNFSELEFAIALIECHRLLSHQDLSKYIEATFLPVLAKEIVHGECKEPQKFIDKFKKEALLPPNRIVELQTISDKSDFLKTLTPPQEINNSFDTMIAEGDEPFNCCVEDLAWKYFPALLQNNISEIMSDKGFEEFSFFMIHQLFRTNKFLTSMASLEEKFDEGGRRRVCAFLRFPYINQIHSCLYSQRDKYSLNLIVNNTKIPFITGDQPLTNIDTQKPSEFFDLFYPVSPTQALLLCKKERWNNLYSQFKNIGEKQVNKLNVKICSGCLKQIYASSAEVFRNNNYIASMNCE